jgi:Flp pilus assembly protein TadB
MKTQARPVKRDTPHPFITLSGVILAFVLVVIALKTTLLTRATLIILAICFVIVFRWVSRWSARAMRERRERELEQLKRTPILHLND